MPFEAFFNFFRNATDTKVKTALTEEDSLRRPLLYDNDNKGKYGDNRFYRGESKKIYSSVSQRGEKRSEEFSFKPLSD